MAELARKGSIEPARFIREPSGGRNVRTYMEKIDARKLTQSELFERRKAVVRLYLKGIAVPQIVAQANWTRAAVDTAIKLYKAGGESALMPAARGRKQGTGRILTEEQEAAILQLIRRRPHQYRLKDSLWDRTLVMQLIEQKFGIQLSVRSAGDYLKRWGMAQPNKRPRERCSTKVRAWLDRNYANLEHRARQDDTEIFWFSKPAALDAEVWGSGRGRNKPAPDTITPAGRQERLSIVSVVNNQGKVRWMILKGVFSPARQIKFVQALIRDTKKKVFLIRDDYDAFRGADFVDWIADHAHEIEMFPE